MKLEIQDKLMERNNIKALVEKLINEKIKMEKEDAVPVTEDELKVLGKKVIPVAKYGNPIVKGEIGKYIGKRLFIKE